MLIFLAVINWSQPVNFQRRAYWRLCKLSFPHWAIFTVIVAIYGVMRARTLRHLLELCRVGDDLRIRFRWADQLLLIWPWRAILLLLRRRLQWLRDCVRSCCSPVDPLHACYHWTFCMWFRCVMTASLTRWCGNCLGIPPVSHSRLRILFGLSAVSFSRMLLSCR